MDRVLGGLVADESNVPTPEGQCAREFPMRHDDGNLCGNGYLGMCDHVIVACVIGML